MFDYLAYTLCYIHNGDASTQDQPRDDYNLFAECESVKPVLIKIIQCNQI